MKISFVDRWRPSGTLSRGPYALVGVVGFAFKHNLDQWSDTIIHQIHMRVLRHIREEVERGSREVLG
jgi:hypothetical protein